ncbi:hypothetical protein HPB48_006382 [Haemaphysalis longicornis]|uniref:Uncharacterized protein n=1 Tax=Haemaphysalis longicornis TaxID=44386 RepID=A0A9J6FMP5_HAELO|nr:hypothetical protein HPB48_006382 [Haemaphysalis longicornis]
MGSDHLPIVVTIKTGSNRSGRGAQVKRDCCVTHWDRYRDILNTLPMTANVSELTQAMTEAKRKATKTLSVPEDHPDLDRHLLSLWNRKLRLLGAYRERGRPKNLRMKLRRIQEEIESSTNQLASERWMATCEQMNGRTNSARSWAILRALLGQRKPNPQEWL